MSPCDRAVCSPSVADATAALALALAAASRPPRIEPRPNRCASSAISLSISSCAGVAAVAWGDLIEIGQVKRSLHTFVVDALSERRKFVRLGIEPPRGVLLYGPPGTGKTALATGFVTCHMSLATYCNVSSRLPYCVSRVTYR